MGTVAVAQHLHAIAVVFRHNDVPRAIKRYAPGTIEPPVPCSLAADGAQVRPVDVAKHLNAMVVTIGHHQVAHAIKRNATRLIKLPITSTSAIRILKLPITSTLAADGAHEACSRSCNCPQPPTQFVAPRQNAGGLPQRMRDGACASETHKPHGKRHGQAAAGKQTMPLFRPQMGAECVPLCGSCIEMKERWALSENGLQLLLAALERP